MLQCTSLIQALTKDGDLSQDIKKNYEPFLNRRLYQLPGPARH